MRRTRYPAGTADPIGPAFAAAACALALGVYLVSSVIHVCAEALALVATAMGGR